MSNVLPATWTFAIGGQLDGVLPRSVTRPGMLCGAAVPVGAAVMAPALLLPQESVAQLALLTLGGIPVLLAWLAIPFWFLLLGRALASAARGRR